MVANGKLPLHFKADFHILDFFESGSSSTKIYALIFLE